MEAHLHANNQDFVEKKNPKEEASSPSSSPPPPPSSSTSSSPSHEFSFTISLQSLSSSCSSSSPKSNPNNVIRNSNRTTSSTHQAPFAIDLSPADEIFFHGHLLPLHFLSHLPVSPRTSTTSFDGFTLQDQSTTTTTTTGPAASSKSGMSTDSHSSSISNINNSKNQASVNVEYRPKAKPNKTFSLFGLPKWRKGLEQKERRGEEQEQEQENQKKKKLMMGLDLSHAFKKYIRMLFQRRENGTQLKRRQAYSFSSASIIGSRKNNIASNTTGYKRDNHLRGRRGEFSAPASMRTSPTNSGHLLVSTGQLSSASSCFASDSTMEELQAAIQAAIAHCKNSFAVDHDKVKNY